MLIFYGIVIFTKLFHTEKNKYSILKKLLYLFFFLIISSVHGGIMGFQNLVGHTIKMSTYTMSGGMD